METKVILPEMEIRENYIKTNSELEIQPSGTHMVNSDIEMNKTIPIAKHVQFNLPEESDEMNFENKIVIAPTIKITEPPSCTSCKCNFKSTFRDSKKHIVVVARRETMVWLLMILIFGVSPILIRSMYLSSIDGTVLKEKFAPSTPNDMGYMISWILAQIVSLRFYGKQGLRDCYRWGGIIRIAPISLAYAIAETLLLVALQDTQPMLAAILSQSRLGLTAVLSRLLLRRNISLTQLLICFSLLASVVAYTLLSLTETTETSGMTKGTVLLIIHTVITTGANLACDKCYKSLQYPFPVQVAQGRLTATMFSLAITAIWFTHNNWWQWGYFGGPQGGWDYKVVILVFWGVLCDWVLTWNLKNLDAVWKGVGSALGLSITYALEMIFFKKLFRSTQFFVVLSIILDAIIYYYESRKQSRALFKSLEQRDT